MSKSKKDGADSPWLEGVIGVTGVVPPGRRLSPPSERRPTKWSASGVQGVRPPGTLGPQEGPSVDWATKRAKKQDVAERQNRTALKKKSQAAHGKKGAAEPDFDPMRPMAGFEPDVFADLGDPDDMKAFLRSINDFLVEHPLPSTAGEPFHQLILQSHAPFEIVVSFTALSAVVGKSTPLRRRYAVSLERGAKVFFNLGARLDPNVKAPRGLVPETVDAIFYDLPSTAYQLPYAFATAALLRLLDLFRTEDDPERDARLVAFAEGLHRRFIEKRSFGDEPLHRMFPWDVPDWAPQPD